MFLCYVKNRWDLEAMEQLPDYMKLYYLALFNTVNEWAYEIFKDHGVDILPYSKKMVPHPRLFSVVWFMISEM